MFFSNSCSQRQVLSQYIQEKNKQVKAFLDKEKKIKESCLGCHHLANSELRRPLTAVPHEICRVDSPCGLEAHLSTGSKVTTGISSELVHDITEIARFCTETKMQQDRQEQKLEKLGTVLQSRETEMTRLNEELRNSKKSQRIRNERFVEQIGALCEEVKSLTNTVEFLRSELEAHGQAVTVEADEFQRGLVETIRPSGKTLDAMYVIGDTEYVVQVIPSTVEEANKEVPSKTVESASTKEAVDTKKTETTSGGKSDEESEMSVFSY